MRNLVFFRIPLPCYLLPLIVLAWDRINGLVRLRDDWATESPVTCFNCVLSEGCRENTKRVKIYLKPKRWLGNSWPIPMDKKSQEPPLASLLATFQLHPFLKSLGKNDMTHMIKVVFILRWTKNDMPPQPRAGPAGRPSGTPPIALESRENLRFP